MTKEALGNALVRCALIERLLTEHRFDRTVREHINDLEQKREQLGSQIMSERNSARRNHLEAELRAVESALTLYRSALEIESRIT